MYTMIPSLHCIFMHQKPEPVTPVQLPFVVFPLQAVLLHQCELFFNENHDKKIELCHVIQ